SHRRSLVDAKRCELIGAVLVRERAYDLFEIALHDRVELVERELDAVIGQAALRKVVRADALGPVARADKAAPPLGRLRAPLRLLGVAQPRVQQRERARTILVLRALVLALDDDTGRNV